MSSTDTTPSVARLPFREPAIAVAHFIVSADVERGADDGLRLPATVV